MNFGDRSGIARKIFAADVQDSPFPHFEVPYPFTSEEYTNLDREFPSVVDQKYLQCHRGGKIRSLSQSWNCFTREMINHVAPVVLTKLRISLGSWAVTSFAWLINDAFVPSVHQDPEHTLAVIRMDFPGSSMSPDMGTSLLRQDDGGKRMPYRKNFMFGFRSGPGCCHGTETSQTATIRSVMVCFDRFASPRRNGSSISTGEETCRPVA